MSQSKVPFSRSLSSGKAPKVSGITALTLLMSSFLNAQPGVRRASINEEIDEARRYRLVGNTRPEETAQNDGGAVASDFPLEHMILQLKRSAGDEQLLEETINSLHDPASPNFHRWTTAAEFGSRFGIVAEDRGKIVQWLESHGFVVNSVAPGAMTIDFSGDAGQIREAFHTEIH
ncbi:MAG TPA: protease pro-enzyme activation domain-containing protein, partial [Bryobacteraceae bacterium]